MASELTTSGVGPIIDPDGETEEETNQGFPQVSAAFAEHTKGCSMKPIKPVTDFYKLRWEFEGAWEADILRGPRKATSITRRFNNLTSEKRACVRGIHNYTVGFNNATFNDKKVVAMHFWSYTCKVYRTRCWHNGRPRLLGAAAY